MNDFSQLDRSGHVRMIDATHKQPSIRTATAHGFVRCSATVIDALSDSAVPKGELFAAARVAGIAATKRTSDLLPLVHPVSVHGVSVELELTRDGVALRSTVRTADRTGVEMEALTAVSVAALSLVNSLKSLDRSVSIEFVEIIEKTGGESGLWRRTSEQQGTFFTGAIPAVMREDQG